MSTTTTHIDNKPSLRASHCEVEGRSKRKQSHQWVPELRFKEFEENWKSLKLIKLSTNGFSNGAFNDPNKVGSGYRIINVLDMYIDGPIQVKTLKRVALDDNEYSKNRVEYGDVFFTRSSLVKEGIAFSNVNLTDEDDLTFDGHLIRMRPNKEEWLPKYLYYTFKTSASRKQFIVRGKTATMTTIGQEDIADVNVPFPSLPEQQKIASFLSAVDEKIQQLTKKKVLLEDYKKGGLQQLFSGQLRFKDENGEDYPDWEEKRLGKICEMTSSKRVYLSDYVQEGIPFYRGKEISELRLNKTPSDILYISEERYNDYKSKYGVPKKDDILVTAVGTLGNILRIRNNDPFYFKDGNLIWFRKIEESPDFVEIILQWNTRELLKTSIGSTQKALTMVELRKLKFDFPCIKEQQKIATYLSGIDAKIAAVNNQITQTQTFKKGLLQQMFV
jgi:type I restriction enzyme S subunit